MSLVKNGMFSPCLLVSLVPGFVCRRRTVAATLATTRVASVAALCLFLLPAVQLSLSVSAQNTDGACGFCPFGYPPSNEDAVLGTLDGTPDTACGVVHEYLMQFSNNPLCGSTREAIFAQNVVGGGTYPDQCGYCVVPVNSGVCTLCADGSIPMSDPSSVIPETGESCGESSWIAAFWEAGEVICTELQGYAANVCGCTGSVTAPVATPSPTPATTATASTTLSPTTVAMATFSPTTDNSANVATPAPRPAEDSDVPSLTSAPSSGGHGGGVGGSRSYKFQLSTAVLAGLLLVAN